MKQPALLSIIIVNYNVKYFLEQCLCSVQKAAAGMDTEIIVVDNNSTDGSVAYLQEKFPWVQIIANKYNAGYGCANNQACQIAGGDYILFLNPDTILAEDCLEDALAILQQQGHLGAVGIRMIDGSGSFLPESKRGFPSPMASFFKLSGLIRLFPSSRWAGRYYMGWLPEKENQEVEVLSGAFMMVKKEVLAITGGFDERFFMYAEDIDLSYRIVQCGFRNYYLGRNTIIHFKGESTRKDIRYTKMFYQAMAIFVEKHYRKKASLFPLFLKMAILARGGLSFLHRAFPFKWKAADPPRALHTLVAGESRAAQKAAGILGPDATISRQLQFTPDIAGIYPQLEACKMGEIIFCAGVLPYRDIISCMENLKGKAAFKLFGEGSSSIAGSNSSKHGGEILLPQKEGQAVK